MSAAIWDSFNPIDVETCTRQYAASQPAHFFCIDGFLRPELARELATSFPSLVDATQLGWRFDLLNEKAKVQISKEDDFPPLVRTLHEALASEEMLALLSQITGIQDLVADPTMAGGGMHVMGTGGYLDLHTDFNMLKETQHHRRLNVLVYLTPDWQEDWGGSFELWDSEARDLQHAFTARFNRCLVFNTTAESFHRVTKIACPSGLTRNSFSAFYYTAEPPPGWDGRFHSTVFRSPPGEWFKGKVQTPLHAAYRRVLRYAVGLFGGRGKPGPR